MVLTDHLHQSLAGLRPFLVPAQIVDKAGREMVEVHAAGRLEVWVDSGAAIRFVGEGDK